MNQDPKILTVVCCYNNNRLAQCLQDDVNRQNMSIRLILLDNMLHNGTCRFSSAANAYNSVLSDLDTKYVVFCHQDILLPEQNLLSSFLTYLDKAEVGDIIGVAGGKQGSEQLLTNIYTDTKKTHVPGSSRVHGLEKCDILDECFFGGRVETFLQTPFDEKLCPGWHLYAAERCLHAIELHHNVYVCDLPVIHTSRGTISSDYNRTFYELSKHYANTVPFLRTTCCYAPTKWPLREIAFFYRKVKLLMGLYRN